MEFDNPSKLNVQDSLISLKFYLLTLFVSENIDLQLSKMNITPLAILGVKWPFSKGRGG